MKRTLVFPAMILLAQATAGTAQQQPVNSDVERGATLYADNCASCHGADLEGQPNWRSPDETGLLPAPPHDETGHTWHHDDALLFNYTKLGGSVAMERLGVTRIKSAMPGFGDSLSDQEIWNILAFIKSTWPKRQRQIQEVRTQAMQMRGN